MRRVPKPFAVEVRRGGRQSAARSFEAQPDWPELREKPAERPPEPVEAPPAAVTPIRRILPALDDPATMTAPPARTKRPYNRRPKPTDVPKMAVEAAKEPARAEPEVEPQAAKAPGIGRLSRLPRSAFPLGERWKARVPAIAFSSFDGKARP